MPDQTQTPTQTYTLKQLDDLWNATDADRRIMAERRDYYDGNHAIMSSEECYADGKPKAKRVTNFIKYIVNRYVGALTATPYQVAKSDSATDAAGVEAYGEIAESQQLSAKDAENLRFSLLYGRAVEVHGYDSEAAQIIIDNYEPSEWVLVYDTDGTLKLAFRRVIIPAPGYHRGQYIDTPLELMTVYDAATVAEYRRDKSKDAANAWVLDVAPRQHFYGAVPVVDWHVKDEQASIISDALIALQDEYNEIDSASGDDIRADTDALLVTKGIDGAWVKQNQDVIKRLRVLPLPDGADANYLMKGTNLDRVKDRLQRCRENIHMMGEVPDVSTIVGATGATSGIALKLMFTPMEEAANQMIPFIKRGLKDRIDLINAIQKKFQKPEIADYTVKVHFRQPVNRLEEWQAIAGLQGEVSHRTRLGLLSDIEDPERELQAIRQEREAVVDADTNPEGAVAAREAIVATKSVAMQPRMEELITNLSEGVRDYMLKSGTLQRVVDRRKAEAAQGQGS